MRRKVLALIATSIFACMLVVFLMPVTVNASDKNSTDKNQTDIVSQVKEQLARVFDSVDKETAGEIFAFVKDKIGEGNLDSADDIKDIVAEAEEKFDVKITEADVKKLVSTMHKLEEMGFSIEDIVGKSESLYNKYGAEFVEHMDEVITSAVKDAVSNVANSFFDNVKSSVKNFFTNLFK